MSISTRTLTIGTGEYNSQKASLTLKLGCRKISFVNLNKFKNYSINWHCTSQKKKKNWAVIQSHKQVVGDCLTIFNPYCQDVFRDTNHHWYCLNRKPR